MERSCDGEVLSQSATQNLSMPGLDSSAKQWLRVFTSREKHSANVSFSTDACDYSVQAHHSASATYLIVCKYNYQVLWLHLANILFNEQVINLDTQR